MKLCEAPLSISNTSGFPLILLYNLINLDGTVTNWFWELVSLSNVILQGYINE